MRFHHQLMRFHKTADKLKQRLVRVWHGMDQTIIDSAIDEWRGHLRACVRAKVDTLNKCCDIY